MPTNRSSNCGSSDMADETYRAPGVPPEHVIDSQTVAILECTEPIPCDPCEQACPFGAIEVGENITQLPRLNPEQCTGCEQCIASCPGLAIFVVNKTYSETTGTVALPYEMVPLPEKGQTVSACDHNGDILTQAKVISVRKPETNDKTAVVTLEIPQKLVMDVRGFYPGDGPANLIQQDLPDDIQIPDEDMLLCRCEEVTFRDVRNAIEDGCHTLDEIKRRTRVGMGLCQGKSCLSSVQRMLAEQLGLSPAEVGPPSHRPPVRPLQLQTLCTMDPENIPGEDAEWGGEENDQ